MTAENKAPKSMAEVRGTTNRTEETAVTPIKDEGKHQVPYDNGTNLRANPKEGQCVRALFAPL